MRASARWSAGLMTMGVIVSLGGGWSPAAFKCGRAITASNPAVYMLNGAVVAENPIPDVDRTSVVALQVFCSHAGHAVYGVEPLRDVVHVVTRDADWSALLGKSMQSIVIGQQDHLARTGSFASALDALPWVEPGRPVEIHLRVSGDGREWTATGRYRDGGDPVVVTGRKE